MHNNLKFLTLLMMVTVVGCSTGERTIKPFKLEIQQGNVVTSEMLLKLRPGMTKSQVQFILGTPLLVDSFHTDRWDYFYQLRKQGEIVSQRRVILDFDGDALTRVRGDVVPEGTNIDALVQQAQSAPKPAKPITEIDENAGLVTTPIEAPVIESAEAAAPSETLVTESATEAPAAEVTKTESTHQETTSTAQAAETAMNAEMAPLVEMEKIEETADASLQTELQTEQDEIEVPVASVPAVESLTEVEKLATPVLEESANIVKPKLKMDRVMSSAPDEVKSRYRVSPTQSAIPTAPEMANKAKLNEEEPGFFERILKRIGF